MCLWENDPLWYFSRLQKCNRINYNIIMCFFRPSGTEDIVRVYAEADTQVSSSGSILGEHQWQHWCSSPVVSSLSVFMNWHKLCYFLYIHLRFCEWIGDGPGKTSGHARGHNVWGQGHLPPFTWYTCDMVTYLILTCNYIDEDFRIHVTCKRDCERLYLFVGGH